MGPQHPVGKRVKGATGDKSASRICKTGRPFQHFLGGLSSKGKKQYGLRRYICLHKSGHPINKGSGLSAPGTGNDQNGAL